MRIVHAMSGGGARTTADVSARLPDVPRATVYRHIGLLTDGGVLEVTAERRVHGAVERSYRIRSDRVVIDAETAASMSRDDHRRGFAAAMAILLAEFNAYLDREDANPYADGVGYRQGIAWLTPDEHAAMIDTLRKELAARAHSTPAPGRRPYLVSAIFFPTEQPQPAAPGGRGDQGGGKGGASEGGATEMVSE